MVVFRHIIAAKSGNQCTFRHGSMQAELLLAAGSPSEPACACCAQVLFDATAEGNAQAVAGLLKAGACANAVDSQGDTPLHVAAQEGHMPVVRLLLEAGALVTPANTSDETAMHVAAWAGHVDVVEALLAAGAPVNCRGPDGETPLLLAADGGHCDVRPLRVSSAA